MTIYKTLKGGSLVVITILLLSCSPTTYREVYPILMDGKYDSEFPYRGCSEQLEQIAESVRMISCIAYYKSYIFPLEAKIRQRDIQDPSLQGKVIKIQYLNRTASGTATIVCFQDRQIAMLTCAHVVDFEDTILIYYRGEDKKPTEFIQSIAIKERQTNYAAAIPGARDLEILAFDKESDLALLGQKSDAQPTFGIKAFSYPLGKAKELEWGAFVYLYGYPAGYRLLTKAIVSDPNRDKYGSFLTDAVSNLGFSGGIVLAIRDGVPNFELVGMVKLVPGRQQSYLTPVQESENIEFKSDMPYKGDVYVDSRIDIIYGVAPIIPVELIKEFLQENQEILLEKGYDIRSILQDRAALKKH